MNDRDPDAIVIEYDIPLPDRARNAGSLYPWDQMRVGGSFFRPTPPGKTVEKHRSALTASANCFSKRQPHPEEWRWLSAFEQREGVIVGVRIWRAPPKHVDNKILPLGAPADAAPPFVDPARVVEAKGYRVKTPRQQRHRPEDAPPPKSDKMPRFVQGKGRY
jgi:hypothetical protein